MAACFDFASEVEDAFWYYECLSLECVKIIFLVGSL